MVRQPGCRVCAATSSMLSTFLVFMNMMVVTLPANCDASALYE
jgi:hypothetical protein